MKKGKEFHTFRGYQILDLEDKILTSSMEDYLEMIYRICMENGYIRINILSRKLNVRPSSTTKIIQKLGILGLVDYEKYGIIRLTDKGKALGNYLLRRHEIIEEFLLNLGVKETLLKDTEMIEHSISPNTLKNFYIFNKFLQENPSISNFYIKFKEKYKNEDIELTYPIK
ncbi:MAG TPA: DtxR family transcriptional regulator [Eubacteriaceae bacterium]|nr:DtxR family transcriptional regulator [Eubacteriaceae bacterium]